MRRRRHCFLRWRPRGEARRRPPTFSRRLMRWRGPRQCTLCLCGASSWKGVGRWCTQRNRAPGKRLTPMASSTNSPLRCTASSSGLRPPSLVRKVGEACGTGGARRGMSSTSTCRRAQYATWWRWRRRRRRRRHGACASSWRARRRPQRRGMRPRSASSLRASAHRLWARRRSGYRVSRRSPCHGLEVGSTPRSSTRVSA
mmetsp:Transcript_50457/g.141211  ORF Transcript_50457/g.141211 Transcript_50457/m.141211 type:complete len:200 (-) Transcript_50457:55-654(-)